MQPLDLLHSPAGTGLVRQIEPLGNNAIQRAAGQGQPLAGHGDVSRSGRKAKGPVVVQVLLGKPLQPSTPLAQGLAGQVASLIGQQIEDEHHSGMLSGQLLGSC